MVDSGENAVAMPLRSRAEFSPYGMDYFSKPNGRWSNGRTFMDLITQELGYGLLSPFLKSIGSNFTSGVNFACSGSTAQNSTASGDDSGGLFSLLVQVDQFREYQEDIEATHRGSLMVSQLKQHFSDSIFFFETAHNDYIDVAFKTTDFDPLNTVIATISAMRQAFEALYSSGARIFFVMNVTPLGCAPSILSNVYRNERRDEYGCKVDYLELVQMHNMHLEKLLGELRIQLPEADWILFDAYSIMLDGYHNPSKYGVKYPFKACCGINTNEYNYNGDVLCGGGGQNINGTYLEAKRCEDPSLYIIWDSIHPIQSFSQYLAQGVVNGTYLRPYFNVREKLHFEEANVLS